MPTPSDLSLNSLQGRWDVIKTHCGCWSGFLEKVRNAPPSDCTIDDYDCIACERFKQIAVSKRKPFLLQHCWNLLPENEKWRLRDQEALPKKGAPVNLEEDDA
uniref:Uncharacterized protein n=1 Tax=Triticum urartu TaxID=4572 RepID=A0A8R7QDH6_TRIUA